MGRHSLRDIVKAIVLIVLITLIIAAISIGGVKATQAVVEEVRRRRKFKAKSGTNKVHVLVSEDEQMISYSFVLKNITSSFKNASLDVNGVAVHTLKPMDSTVGELWIHGIWRQPGIDAISALREGRMQAVMQFKDSPTLKMNLRDGAD